MKKILTSWWGFLIFKVSLYCNCVKMKQISKVIHYWFLKPTQENGKYFFIRSQTEGMESYSWFMGYENHMGLVSSVGGTLSGTLVDELEREFQSSIM